MPFFSMKTDSFIKYDFKITMPGAEVAQPGKARAWNMYDSQLVSLCDSGVQISPSAPDDVLSSLLLSVSSAPEKSPSISLNGCHPSSILPPSLS